MKTIAVAVVAAIVVAVAVGMILVFGGPVLEVHDVEARLGVGSGAVFLTIHNHGLLGDCLIGVNVIEPAGLKAELHRSVLDEKGVVRMERLERICVGGLSEVRLAGIEEGGLHIMILGDTHDLKKLEIELIFQSGRKIPLHLSPTDALKEEHAH